MIDLVTLPGLYKILGDLPLCRKVKQSRGCFYRVVRSIEAEKKIKPCSTMQYKIDKVVLHTNNPRQAKLRMKFATPARVTVKEEFLIYDTIGMIRSSH